MDKLLKYSGDIKKSLKTVCSKMSNEGFEYVTWHNSQTGARFVARKSTVEKMYKEKFENAKVEISDNEVVKLSNTSLTTNEIRETGGGTVIEGLHGKDRTEIKLSEAALVEKVLYDNNFDCSILFK